MHNIKKSVWKKFALHPTLLLTLLSFLTFSIIPATLNTVSSHESFKSSTQEILATFPKTVEDIDKFSNSSISELESGIRSFIAQRERTFKNTILEWDRLGTAFVTNMRMLEGMSTVTQDQSVLFAANAAVKKMKATLKAAFSNPDIKAILTKYVARVAASPKALSASQWQYINELIKSMDLSKVPTLEKSVINHYRLPYTFLKGVAEEKTASESLSVLTWNMLGFKGHLSFLYGGMLPWKTRIDHIINKLKAIDADVICLQEVFDAELADELYDRLKETYSYFYSKIGVKNVGLTMDSIGISSGLFVASKYPLREPSFTPFTNNIPSRNYGFFECKVVSKGKPVARIVTTHLYPFSGLKDQKLRQEQITQIIERLECIAQKDKTTPLLLVGDMNVKWGSNESALRSIKEHFIDTYNHEPTATDFTDYWWGIKTPPVKRKSIDYALLFKSPTYSHYSLKTDRIVMYDEKNPEESLSDHNALLSTITRNPQSNTGILQACAPNKKYLEHKSTTFLLIRHGKTDWNVQNKIQGYSDIPLNDLGREQAKKAVQLLLEHYPKIDAIYSSDLKRAVSTAEPIAHAFGLKLITNRALREQNMGDAEGMPEEEYEKLYGAAFRNLESKYPDQWQRWHHNPVPHAETKAHLFNRVEKFLKNIARKHQGKTIAIVTHGAVMKTLIAYYTQVMHHTPNCCVAEMRLHAGNKDLVFITIKK